MERPEPIYGLDIETDTSIDGLDPVVAPIVTAALSTPAGDEVFSGPEPDLIARLDRRLGDLPAGVIATWNGAAFDLPFLADRARCRDLVIGLRLALDPGVVARRPPLRGHRGAYRATWHRHRHLDAYRLYRADVGPVLRVSCSLKAIARVAGLTPIEVDRHQIHRLSEDVLRAYVASDARLARQLAERRWPGAAYCVDHPRHQEDREKA